MSVRKTVEFAPLGDSVKIHLYPLSKCREAEEV